MTQVRQRVNALAEAFQRRSDERVTSTVAHKLAAGTFALQEALSSGRPYEAEVCALCLPMLQAAHWSYLVSLSAGFMTWLCCLLRSWPTHA